MAMKNTLTEDVLVEALPKTIKRNISDAENVVVSNISVPQSSGLSAETVMFSASWQRAGVTVDRDFVARVQPSGPALFMDYDLEAEFKVMHALSTTSVPVPAVLFVETDTSFLGAPFLVMERVDGDIAADDPPFTVEGWVLDLPEEQRALLADNSLKAMVDLHNQNIVELGLDNIGHGNPELSGFDRLIDYWAKKSEWVLEEKNPTISAALEWVFENKPDDTDSNVLSWGDARLGNMIIAKDQSVAAIIDWEMLSCGPRELDLGWWLFLLKHHSVGVGAELPSGFKTRDEEIARYEELSGHKVRNLHYFEVFAGLRMAILVARAASLLKSAGYIPKDSPMALINPATNLLAELLGLPAPVGESDYYIGSRT